MNVVIRRQRYTLLPGIQKVHRRVTVRGQDIDDVPTQYSMHGLEPYELPVVGKILLSFSSAKFHSTKKAFADTCLVDYFDRDLKVSSVYL